MPNKPSESSTAVYLIVAGSYEGGIGGYSFNEAEATFEQLFGYQAHIGAVKTVSCEGRHLATGGSDEVVHLFDVHNLREAGGLSCHKSSVTAVALHGNVLLSCSAEGELSVNEWKGGEWNSRLVLQAHKSAVTGAAIHSSSRVALTVSADGSMKMWDLMRGTCAYVHTLSSESSVFKAIPSDVSFYNDSFLITMQNKLFAGSLASEEIKQIQGVFSKAAIIAKDVILVGDVKGNLMLLSMKDDSRTPIEGSPHTGRIKGISLLNQGLLLTVCSEGTLAIWKFDGCSVTPVVKTEAKIGRITCVSSCRA